MGIRGFLGHQEGNKTKSNTVKIYALLWRCLHCLEINLASYASIFLLSLKSTSLKIVLIYFMMKNEAIEKTPWKIYCLTSQVQLSLSWPSVTSPSPEWTFSYFIRLCTCTTQTLSGPFWNSFLALRLRPSRDFWDGLGGGLRTWRSPQSTWQQPDESWLGGGGTEPWARQLLSAEGTLEEGIQLWAVIRQPSRQLGWQS